ncbi:MAG: hypothetical protein SPJ57_03255 [Candidatus Methanomethylophilaceae archaeon]|nr:hypothetical protein [Candidatus Methanomethylophilaceae archaeon]
MARVDVTLPSVTRHFDASYSEVTKPTGVQYIILTMIGSRSFGNMSWSEVLGSIGVSEDMFQPIFSRELERMRISGMIDYQGRMDLHDRVSVVSFTEVGRQAFEKGVIATSTKEFSGGITYIPASAGAKYVRELTDYYADQIQMEDGFFDGLVPDEQKIENTIIKEKKAFGVGEDFEVFDIIIGEEARNGCYRQSIDLDLDPVTGRFMVNSRGLDDAFLKRRFDAEQLLSYLSPAFFSSQTNDLEFSCWRSELPEWESLSYHLPSSIDLRKSKLVLVNGTSCRSNRYASVGDREDFDLISIEGPLSGTEYCLVNIEVSVMGFSGSVRRNLIVGHTVDRDRILKVVGEVMERMDVRTFDDLCRALDMARSIDDQKMSVKLVSDYLGRSKDLVSDIQMLQSRRSEAWYHEMPSMIEEIVVEREMDADTISDILSKTSTKVFGSSIARMISKGDMKTRMRDADRILPFIQNINGFIRDTGLSAGVSEMVRSREARPYVSKPLSSASNFTRNLDSLMAIFGMKSLSDYSFDLEDIGVEHGKEVVSMYSTLNKDMEALRQNFPEVCDQEVRGYVSFFHEMSDFCKSVDSKKISDNNRLFALKLCAELEDNLRSYVDGEHLVDLIREAHESKIISDKDFRDLEEFREFRNKCAHRVKIPSLDKNKRKRWEQVIKGLRPKGGFE